MPAERRHRVARERLRVRLGGRGARAPRRTGCCASRSRRRSRASAAASAYAASTSSQLLNDISLPCRTSAPPRTPGPPASRVQRAALVRVLAVAEVARLLEREPDERRATTSSASCSANHPATAASYAAVCANAAAAEARRVSSVRPPSRRSSSTISSYRAGIDHHADRREVLRRRAHHRRPADVDLLDHVLEPGAARDGLAERIQVRRPADRTARSRARPARSTCSALRRSASSPPWIFGCSVFTRPPSISGTPVTSSTGVTGIPASRERLRRAAGRHERRAQLDERAAPARRRPALS